LAERKTPGARRPTGRTESDRDGEAAGGPGRGMAETLAGPRRLIDRDGARSLRLAEPEVAATVRGTAGGGIRGSFEVGAAAGGERLKCEPEGIGRYASGSLKWRGQGRAGRGEGRSEMRTSNIEHRTLDNSNNRMRGWRGGGGFALRAAGPERPPSIGRDVEFLSGSEGPGLRRGAGGGRGRARGEGRRRARWGREGRRVRGGKIHGAGGGRDSCFLRASPPHLLLAAILTCLYPPVSLPL